MYASRTCFCFRKLPRIEIVCCCSGSVELSYPDKKVRITTVHRLTNFGTRVVFVTGAHRAIPKLEAHQFRLLYRLQEFNIAVGFFIFCVEELMWSRSGYVLNGTHRFYRPFVFVWRGLNINLHFSESLNKAVPFLAKRNKALPWGELICISFAFLYCEHIRRFNTFR
jgi:hypothetical protein